MARTLSLLLTASVLSALPVQAADQKQCADQFKAADLNNDGVLNRSEIGNAKSSLPASLASKDRVTRSQFISVCSKGAAKN